MTGLGKKIGTFFTGTRREIVENGVEGMGWIIANSAEPFAGLMLYVSAEEIPTNIPVYIAGALMASGATRAIRALYKAESKIRPDSDIAPSIMFPEPGIIGTVREGIQYLRRDKETTGREAQYDNHVRD